MSVRPSRAVTLAALAGLALAAPAAAANERPHYVRPGAPGEPTQRISPEELIEQRYTYSDAERQFMQHMIVHHGQAVLMGDLAPDRSSWDRLRTVADRIASVQESEIGQMSRWLRLRDEEVPDPYDHEGHEDMPGLASDQEMAQLEAAEGEAFDELFLELMITHHRGGIRMARDLQQERGGALDPNVSAIVSEVIEVQSAEIDRMELMLRQLRG